MSRHVKVIGVFFFALVVAMAVGLVATRPAAAAPASVPLAQACELPPSVDGSADPTFVMPGQNIRFTVWNFRAGEEASFWFTTPGGTVVGTAQPLCCVGSDGYIRFAPVQIPQSFGQEPGRWAFTVQGAASQHTSVVYFCVSNTAQPTVTAVPPTNTAVPPTATSVPATATGVPATATTEATTQPTAPVATAEATVQPTSPPATVEPTVAPPPEVTVVPTPEVIGMPRTGESLPVLSVVMILLSAMLLGAGIATRRRAHGGAK